MKQRISRLLMTLVALMAMTAGAWADKKVFFPEGSIVYDFEAAANAGENPGNKNGSSANGQAFYGWEKSDRTDSKRQDYKGYEWAEGSVLPEVCHVWRRSDRINGNVANNGGLKCPSDKEMAIDGLVAGDKVVIVYDATNATTKEMIWAIGDGTTAGGPGTVRATATINGVEAVTGQTPIPSGAVIQVNKVTPTENGSGYIVFKVFKDMVIKQIVVIPAGIVFPVEPEGLEVTWDATTKEATFTMPDGNVELIPEYYPGMLTFGPATEGTGTVEVVGLSPRFTQLTVPDAWDGSETHLSADNLPGFKEMTDVEAIAWSAPKTGGATLIYGFEGEKVKLVNFFDGVYQNSSSAIETLGNVHFISVHNYKVFYSIEGQMPEGFEMDYEGNICVAEGTEFTVIVTPAEGFHLVTLMKGTEDISAEVGADGTVSITMPAGYDGLTLTATFSDKYNVTLNAEELSDDEAAAWKAATGDNDPAALPLENVSAGSEVKVTYTGTKKVIGVKAEKKAAAAEAKTITIGGVELTYADGDKWETIVRKNSDKIKIVSNHIVQLAQPAPDTYYYLDADGPVRPAHVIDPTKNYSWGEMALE